MKNLEVFAKNDFGDKFKSKFEFGAVQKYVDLVYPEQIDAEKYLVAGFGFDTTEKELSKI